MTLDGMALTHKELVVRAERWLRNTKGCSVVLCELVTGAGEIPDAIGWKGCESILVECKTSRADFLRDKNKIWHRVGTGMGNLRFYLAPPGIIKREDVPPYWGLLECGPRSVKVIKRASHRVNYDTAAEWEKAAVRDRREILMLVSALRRAQERNQR